MTEQQRIVAVIASQRMLDANVTKAFDEFIANDRIDMGCADEWRAHWCVEPVIRACLKVREETPVESPDLVELVRGATDLWVIWDGLSTECRYAIEMASRNGLRVQVTVFPRGAACSRRKTEREVAEDAEADKAAELEQ